MSDAEVTKRCTKCKEDLPATPEFFWRRVYNVDGLWDICKACCSEMPCMVNRTAKRHAAKLQSDAAKVQPGTAT